MIETLALLVALAILAGIIRRCFGAGARISESDPLGTFRGCGKFGIQIVGESHYQEALERISGGRTKDGVELYVKANLILEDSNPHDGSAVRVDIQAETVGYLSRHDARKYREALRNAGHPRLIGSCDAVIRGGWYRGRRDMGYFGVRLDLSMN
jgi:hypothetical protein